jgi:hypothetical protein
VSARVAGVTSVPPLTTSVSIALPKASSLLGAVFRDEPGWDVALSSSSPVRLVVKAACASLRFTESKATVAAAVATKPVPLRGAWGWALFDAPSTVEVDVRVDAEKADVHAVWKAHRSPFNVSISSSLSSTLSAGKQRSSGGREAAGAGGSHDGDKRRSHVKVVGNTKWARGPNEVALTTTATSTGFRSNVVLYSGALKPFGVAATLELPHVALPQWARRKAGGGTPHRARAGRRSDSEGAGDSGAASESASRSTATAQSGDGHSGRRPHSAPSSAHRVVTSLKSARAAALWKLNSHQTLCVGLSFAGPSLVYTHVFPLFSAAPEKAARARGGSAKRAEDAPPSRPARKSATTATAAQCLDVAVTSGASRASFTLKFGADAHRFGLSGVLKG